MKSDNKTHRPRLVIDSAIPFVEGLFDAWAEVVRLPGREIGRREVAQADALLIRTRTRCNRELLEGSRVRLIATATIGYDHIDLHWCREQGIEVVTAVGCNARGVLQWVAGVLAHFAQKEGWRPEERTLGVVGVGHVGSLVKAYAEEWGFRVLCCDPPRAEREGFPSLDIREMAPQCDIITFHTPLDATTHHLCNDELLKLLPEGALVINSSRGEVVDNEALLRSAHPTALDVWEHEPHPNPALLAHAEVATTHIAGYSLQGKANASALAVRAIARHFGWPLEEWYPEGVSPVEPRAIEWQELCTTISRYFDAVGETTRLKHAPECFEAIRDNYAYRKEYF